MRLCGVTDLWFCRDIPACNYTARIRLGITESQALRMLKDERADMQEPKPRRNRAAGARWRRLNGSGVNSGTRAATSPSEDGYWGDPQTGRRQRRATHEELHDASRLWTEHRDIREGRADA